MIEFDNPLLSQISFAKPKPIEKPQVVPPIRKDECSKKHITQSGKK